MIESCEGELGGRRAWGTDSLGKESFGGKGFLKYKQQQPDIIENIEAQ